MLALLPCCKTSTLELHTDSEFFFFFIIALCENSLYIWSWCIQCKESKTQKRGMWASAGYALQTYYLPSGGQGCCRLHLPSRTSASSAEELRRCILADTRQGRRTKRGSAYERKSIAAALCRGCKHCAGWQSGQPAGSSCGNAGASKAGRLAQASGDERGSPGGKYVKRGNSINYIYTKRSSGAIQGETRSEILATTLIKHCALTRTYSLVFAH